MSLIRTDYRKKRLGQYMLPRSHMYVRDVCDYVVCVM